MNKKAIFISAIDFDSPVQIGDHQLAKQFAIHGWEIAFLSTPITPFHLFGRHSLTIKRRLQNSISGGSHHKFGQGEIWSYVPTSFLIPKNNILLNWNWVYKNWNKLIVPSVTATLKKKDLLKVDLLYIRDPLQAFYLDLVDTRRTIYRIADRDSGFQHYNDRVSGLEKLLAQRVDVVIYTARELEQYVANLSPQRMYFLPNGVDNAHFKNASQELPDDFREIRRPIVIYVGSIDYWFDFDLFNRLAGELADISFVVIGSTGRYHSSFTPRANVHLLGPKEYSKIPAYLHHADVGVIPFDVDRYPELVNSINPLKLYEYMACGLPVVSTEWNALRNIHSPAVLCSTDDEFITSVRTIIRSERDIETYRTFSLSNDWSMRYQEMVNLLMTIQ